MTHFPSFKDNWGKNVTKNNIVMIIRLEIRIWYILTWFHASGIHFLRPKINFFSFDRALLCSNWPFSSYFIQTYSKQGKKWGILSFICNYSYFKGKTLQIWFTAKNSKSVRQILLILHFNIKILFRKPQGVWGTSGNGIF